MCCEKEEARAALDLAKIVIEAEGTPIEQLREDSKPDQPIRAYILDTVTECLIALRGQRKGGPLAGGNGNGAVGNGGPH